MVNDDRYSAEHNDPTGFVDWGSSAPDRSYEAERLIPATVNWQGVLAALFLTSFGAGVVASIWLWDWRWLVTGIVVAFIIAGVGAATQKKSV